MEKFIDDVFEKFTEEITDRIFLFIQEDTEKDGLLDRYLDLISTNTRQSVNSAIGEHVNKYFELENKKDGNGNVEKGVSKGFLIKTEYTKHQKSK